MGDYTTYGRADFVMDRENRARIIFDPSQLSVENAKRPVCYSQTGNPIKFDPRLTRQAFLYLLKVFSELLLRCSDKGGSGEILAQRERIRIILKVIPLVADAHHIERTNLKAREAVIPERIRDRRPCL